MNSGVSFCWAVERLGIWPHPHQQARFRRTIAEVSQSCRWRHRAALLPVRHYRVSGLSRGQRPESLVLDGPAGPQLELYVRASVQSAPTCPGGCRLLVRPLPILSFRCSIWFTVSSYQVSPNGGVQLRRGHWRGTPANLGATMTSSKAIRSAQRRQLQRMLGRLLRMGGIVSLLVLLHEHRRPIPLATLRTFQTLLVWDLKTGEVGEH